MLAVRMKVYRSLRMWHMNSIHIRNKWNVQITNIYKILLIALIILLALLLRSTLVPYQSHDYTASLSEWYDFVKSHGGFGALRYKFSDYNVPYLYLLALITYIPLSKLVMIKAISIIADFFLALLMYLVVKVKYKTGYLPLLSSFVVLFSPIVFINSAFWGQCDAIYAAFSLGCIYFFMTKRPTWAFIFFGIALSFKLQAIFLFPLLLIFVLTGKVSVKYVLIIPTTYLMLLLPAYLIGRPFLDLLTIYVSQSQEFHQLSLNAPNFYQWIPENGYFTVLNTFGIALTAACVLVITFVVYKSHKEISSNLIVKLSFIFVLIIPFFLPKMHERYFYLAVILSIAYGFWFPRYFYIPFLVQIASFFSYFPFLFHATPISLADLALITLFVIIVTVADLIRDLYFKAAETGMKL